MGFNSMDDLVSEISSGKYWRQDWNKITAASAYTAGRWYCFSPLAGVPIANTWTGTALNWQSTNDASGFSLYHGGAVTPDTKHVLNLSAITAVATGVPGQLMLVDMQGYYPGISMNLATAQTLVGTPTLRYANGDGIKAYFVITTASGATAHNITMSYTNQSGVAARTPPVTVSCTASAIAGHITHSGTAANNYQFIPYASGDRGIQSVQTVTVSAASGAGVAALVLCRPLLTIPLTVAGIATERDMLNQIPALPQIKEGACLTWLYFAGNATAASTNFYGSIDFGWG